MSKFAGLKGYIWIFPCPQISLHLWFFESVTQCREEGGAEATGHAAVDGRLQEMGNNSDISNPERAFNLHQGSMPTATMVFLLFFPTINIFASIIRGQQEFTFPSVSLFLLAIDLLCLTSALSIVSHPVGLVSHLENF